MLGSLKLLDRIVRGEMTRPSQLQDGKLTFPIYGVSFVGLALAIFYGACMGSLLDHSRDRAHPIFQRLSPAPGVDRDDAGPLLSDAVGHVSITVCV